MQADFRVPCRVTLSLRKFGFLIHGFWASRKSSIFVIWAAPAAPKTIPTGEGLGPPRFSAPPGPPGPQKLTIPGPAQEQCIKNPSVGSVGDGGRSPCRRTSWCPAASGRACTFETRSSRSCRAPSASRRRVVAGSGRRHKSEFQNLSLSPGAGRHDATTRHESH